MLSKILLCTIRGKWVFHKSHVFWWIIFFKKEFCKQFNIHLLFRSQRPKKLPVSAIKTQIDNNRPKILLARRAHKWSRQLACSNYGPNRAIVTSANVKTYSCEIISKSDQWFLRTRFFALYRHEFLHDCVVQEAPIHQSHIYRQIKILWTNFEKGHPRNIPMKLFQYLTSSFGEKSFLRISKSDQQFRRRRFFKNFFMSL